MRAGLVSPLRQTGCRARQRGQSLVEFVIVVPVFLFLVLLILQAALLYRVKTTLDYATLEAARAGAVAGAKQEAIRRGLQRGLMPLFAHEPTQAGVSAAWARAGDDLDDHAGIDIINPTREAWDTFKERQHDNRLALPNDSLAFRDATVHAAAGGVNLQDANLLKIRVVYCYPLVVPFVDRVLRGASLLVRGGADTAMSRTGGETHYRLQIESYAIVRMQSPIYQPEASSLPRADTEFAGCT